MRKFVVVFVLMGLAFPASAMARHTPWELLYRGGGFAMRHVHVRSVELTKHRRIRLHPTRNEIVRIRQARAHVILRPWKASVTNHGHGLVWARINYRP